MDNRVNNRLLIVLKVIIYFIFLDVPSLIFEFANIKPTKSILSLKDD